MTDPLRILIRPNWDSALTYDSLDEQPDNRSVFVGRESLIAPLVAEIVEPSKRGTYLISGYRGTGKTTLLIEALSRAKGLLKARNYKLFPVVLNVSEVAASLGNASSPVSPRLDIDPRRLLIALLRTIKEEVKRLAVDDSKLSDLAESAQYAYEKATASKYAQTAMRAQETARSRSREMVFAFEDKNVLKTLAAIAGAGAIAAEVAALLKVGWLHAAAVVLGAVCAISLTFSIKRSSTEKQTEGRQTAFEHDNSLQQLETDLKDLLASLKRNKMRTVVVMEELDKIEDEDGSQLAAVIRYFKNLFTQAPALFFFVTDKSYFDIISNAIKVARRNRSYAVEHTFFTHRIFVGRPTTEECLQFIGKIATDDGQRKSLAQVADSLGKPGRIDEVDQLGRFVRVILFNAANHLFDLKNELRRFARTEQTSKGEEGSFFLIDDQTLPPEVAALAVFQDLIVEKTRSFEIKGGRTYANETLADNLYAVFNELGSNQPQKIDSFLPGKNAAKSTETNTEQHMGKNEKSKHVLLLDEQLNLSEAARVRDAVHSLIGDLERGRAFQSRDSVENTFTWRDDAARSFRYVRQLQKHEESLIADLQRHSALATALYADVIPPLPHPLALEFDKRVVEVRDAREPMTADAAATEQREVIDRYSDALRIECDVRVGDLRGYGFVIEPVATGLGGSLNFIKPLSGDPRFTTTSSPGGVLLAFGETETLLEDVWQFFRPETQPPLSPLKRAALVHVIHVTGTVSVEVKKRHEQWNQALSERAQGLEDFHFAVHVVPLVDPDPNRKLKPVEQAAAALTGYSAWIQRDGRAYDMIPSLTPNLVEELGKWWQNQWVSGQPEIFHIATSVEGGFRPFYERDALEHDGGVVLNVGSWPRGGSVMGDLAAACMLVGSNVRLGDDDRWEPLGRWLVNTKRVVVYVDWQGKGSWTADDIRQLIDAGGIVILVHPGSVPEELKSYRVTTAPLASLPGSSAKA